MANHTAKDNTPGQTELYTLVTLITASSTEMVSGAVVVDHSQTVTKATMLTTINVASVSFSGQAATYTKESTKMTRGMATVRCIGPMAAAIRANGSAESSMDTVE